MRRERDAQPSGDKVQPSCTCDATLVRLVDVAGAAGAALASERAASGERKWGRAGELVAADRNGAVGLSGLDRVAERSTARGLAGVRGVIMAEEEEEPTPRRNAASCGRTGSGAVAPAGEWIGRTL